MEVGADLEMADGFVFLGPAVEAEAGEGGVAVGGGDVAEDFVVSAVFANDEEAVLEARERRALGDGGEVGVEDGLGQGFGSGQGAEVEDAQAAVVEGADVGGGGTIVVFAAVGAGAFALGVGDVKDVTAGREGDGGGVPADGDVLDYGTGWRR